jgi:hypothetical protein
VEAQKRLPSKEIELETKDGFFYFFKADILTNQITYSSDKEIPANLVTISGKRAFEIIGLNRRGIKPDSLQHPDNSKPETKKSMDLLEQESLTRFDKSKKERSEAENRNVSGNNVRRKKRKGNRPNFEARTNSEGDSASTTSQEKKQSPTVPQTNNNNQQTQQRRDRNRQNNKPRHRDQNNGNQQDKSTNSNS